MDQPRQTREGAAEARPEARPEARVNGPEVIETMGFDRVLQRLRAVVSQLETGQLSLEDSLRVYEEGIALARRAHHVLDNAEKRVELLVRDSARNGEMTATPFDEDEDADDHGSGERR
jgi:exodeoxyribonuclease VII small subunit